MKNSRLPRDGLEVRQELLGDEDRGEVVHLGGGVDRLLRRLPQRPARKHPGRVHDVVDVVGLGEHDRRCRGDVLAPVDVGLRARPAEREHLGAVLTRERGDVGADPVAAAEHDQRLAVERLAVLRRRSTTAAGAGW